MHKDHLQLAHLLLAAGASTRMGRPKQLLDWQGESLLHYALRQIREAAVSDRIIVVLGAHHELIAPKINATVEVVWNADWAEGMGSSVRCGMELLKDADNYTGVCISLVDQPLVQAAHYRQLFRAWRESDKMIAAAQYKQILGVPAIFSRAQFPALMALSGAAGARKILQQLAAEVQPFDLPEAAFDLDTPEDYDQLRRHPKF